MIGYVMKLAATLFSVQGIVWAPNVTDVYGGKYKDFIWSFVPRNATSVFPIFDENGADTLVKYGGTDRTIIINDTLLAEFDRTGTGHTKKVLSFRKIDKLSWESAIWQKEWSKKIEANKQLIEKECAELAIKTVAAQTAKETLELPALIKTLKITISDSEVGQWVNTGRGITKNTEDASFLRKMLFEHENDILTVVGRFKLHFRDMNNCTPNFNQERFTSVLTRALNLFMQGSADEQVAEFLNVQRALPMTDGDLHYFLSSLSAQKNHAAMLRILAEDSGNNFDAAKQRLDNKFELVVDSLPHLTNPAVAKMQAEFPDSAHHRTVLREYLANLFKRITFNALDMLKQGQSDNNVDQYIETSVNNELSNTDFMYLAALAQERTATQRSRPNNNRRHGQMGRGFAMLPPQESHIDHKKQISEENAKRAQREKLRLTPGTAEYNADQKNRIESASILCIKKKQEKSKQEYDLELNRRKKIEHEVHLIESWATKTDARYAADVRQGVRPPTQLISAIQERRIEIEAERTEEQTIKQPEVQKQQQESKPAATTQSNLIQHTSTNKNPLEPQYGLNGCEKIPEFTGPNAGFLRHEYYMKKEVRDLADMVKNKPRRKICS
jgi:hypothetical protein